MTGGWRTVRNKGIHTLQTSYKKKTSGVLKCVGRVARTGRREMLTNFIRKGINKFEVGAYLG